MPESSLRNFIRQLIHDRVLALLLKNNALAKFWRVDKETAERLNLRSIKPDGAKHIAPPTSHRKKISERKAAIIKIFQNSNCYPRQCIEKLKKDYKIDIVKYINL